MRRDRCGGLVKRFFLNPAGLPVQEGTPVVPAKYVDASRHEKLPQARIATTASSIAAVPWYGPVNWQPASATRIEIEASGACSTGLDSHRMRAVAGWSCGGTIEISRQSGRNESSR
ncbi:MAG: hypothetical protein FJZ01_01470 [Candidatus Sericytochromatia bacterium]|nr:hypothetical protein [Candidatus Tanganyikabacteria bacterium]